MFLQMFYNDCCGCEIVLHPDVLPVARLLSAGSVDTDWFQHPSSLDGIQLRTATDDPAGLRHTLGPTSSR